MRKLTKLHIASEQNAILSLSKFLILLVAGMLWGQQDLFPSPLPPSLSFTLLKVHFYILHNLFPRALMTFPST